MKLNIHQTLKTHGSPENPTRKIRIRPKKKQQLSRMCKELWISMLSFVIRLLEVKKTYFHISVFLKNYVVFKIAIVAYALSRLLSSLNFSLSKCFRNVKNMLV